MEYRTGRIDELAGCGPIPQRAILDGIPDIIFVKDCDGRYLTCNAAFEAYVGRTEPDMVGLTDQDLFPPETAASYRRHDRVALASGRGCHNEEWITYPDGRRSLIDTLKTPCRGADGTLLGIAGISRDITARRLAEDALRETTERLTLATRAGGVGTWAYDVAHNKLVWDDQMLRLYGVTRDQFSGAYDAWHVGVHPEDRQRGDAEIQLALEGKKEFDTVFRVLWPDGTTRTIRARATVQRDAAGQPLRMIGANWDVTTQKQTEEALRESEVNFRRLFESTPVPMAVSTMSDRRFISVNSAFLETLGYPREEVIGRTSTEIGLFVDGEVHRRAAAQLQQEGRLRNVEMGIRAKDGRIVAGLFSGEIIPNQREQSLLTVMVDISTIKDSKLALEQSRAFQSEITGISQLLVKLPWEQADEGITRSLGQIGAFVGADRAYIYLFRDDGELMDNSHEWCAEGIAPQIELLQDLPLAAFPWLIRKLKNFETIHIPRVADLPPEAATEKATLELQAIQSLIFVPLQFGHVTGGFLGFDSGTEERAWLRHVPLLRIVGDIFSGILERKRVDMALQEANSTLENKVAERTRESVEESQRARQAAEQVNRDLKQAETRLVMHEKLAAIGRLAAGVAHELNNPIGFLMNNFAAMQDSVGVFGRLMAEYQNLRRKAGGIAELAADAARLEEQEKAGHLDFVLGDIDAMFEESREGFSRVMRIIQSMRDFTRIERAEEKSAYKINDAVQSTLEIAHNEIKYHCTVEADYGATPPVLCVPGQVNQVLLNLVVNAAQAIAGQNRREKGTIGIRTYAEGEMVCCDVSDDGPGLPAAIRDRVFEPFFTIQPPGKGTGTGTGLGLSISYDIVVNRHGGTLEVDSREGGGCVFRLRLPRVPGRAPGEGAPS